MNFKRSIIVIMKQRYSDDSISNLTISHIIFSSDVDPLDYQPPTPPFILLLLLLPFALHVPYDFLLAIDHGLVDILTTLDFLSAFDFLFH